MNPPVPINAGQLDWRVDQIERRLAKIEDDASNRAEILARMDERQTALFADVRTISRDMAGVKRALYALLASLSLAAVAAAVDIASRING
jgi:class 3 adenylate cyclase